MKSSAVAINLQWWRAQPFGAQVYVALWVLYLCCYPFAVAGVALDVRAPFPMAWAGSFLLLLDGALAVCWLGLMFGWRQGTLVAGVIALGAALGETLGVATGWPFGPYRYAAILWPPLPGGVPLPVIGAWLHVVVGAVAAATVLAPRPWRIPLATLLGVALDLVLEPVAVHVEGYWQWLVSGPYDGIPLSNFVGWGLLCAIFCSLALRFPRPTGKQEAILRSGVGLYLSTAVLFGIVAATHHLAGAAAIGGLVVLVVGGVLLASRHRATYDTP